MDALMVVGYLNADITDPEGNRLDEAIAAALLYVRLKDM